jgi:4-amino-4-deoxy-L-arabinose transferase-like glycosyltransferase
MTSISPQDRREWRQILLFTLAGAVLRSWSFGRLGLNHFDEGIYALAGLWSVSPGGLPALDPFVIPYAPPGFPILVGLGYLVLGVSDTSPLLASLICGIATIPLAGWLGRRTFGPGAGAASAALAALAMAHVAFSRKALTDAPFLLAWIASIGLGCRFLEAPRVGRAIVFGVAVGLAENLKYNGWISGAVVLFAAVFGVVSNPPDHRRSGFLRTLVLGLIAAGVAAACYLPWYQFVERHGGYSDLLRHQRSYLGGIEAWLPHWRQQLAQVVALSGGRYWGIATWSAAWLACSFASCGWAFSVTRSRWNMARLRLGLLLGAATMAAIPDLGWWAGLAWVPWLVCDAAPSIRVLGCWWLVLSLMTPFYHPYARLWLPLHAVGWLLLAGAIVRVGPFSESVLSVPNRAKWLRPAFLARCAAVILCACLARWHWQESPTAFPFSLFTVPTDEVRNTVFDLPTTSPLPADEGVTLRVLARRPVAFYLALQGKIRFRLLADRAELIDPASPVGTNDWALIDRALEVEGNLEDEATLTAWRLWRKIPLWKERLDPVTLLDVMPEAAFSGTPDALPLLVLLAPAPPRAATRLRRALPANVPPSQGTPP